MMSPKESVRTVAPPRWPALVGGGLLNVALGTYYAWSVFVPALEREFHWTRTQTSLVATIDMVMLASSFLLAAGQPLEGPQPAEGASPGGADLRGAADPDVLRALVRLCARHHGRHDGHQPIGAVRARVRLQRAERGIRDHHRRDRQRLRPLPVGLDVRSSRPPPHASRHRRPVDAGHAVAVSLARGAAD